MSRGHIRASGRGSWEIKFDAPRADGKRQVRYVTFRGTKREAQAELTKLLAAQEAGTYVDPSKLILGEFLDRWLRDWADINVSLRTAERYHGLVCRQIKPHLGAMPIQRLRALHLTELYVRLLREGGADGGPLAARTVGHVHRCLRGALSHAVLWGVLPSNPAAAVRPPKVAEREIEIVREPDLRPLLDQLDGHLRVIAILSLATGMRRGEMLALRWQDVDLDAGTIQIERSLEQTAAGKLRFKSTKTRDGRRNITIPPSLVAELRAWRLAQQEIHLALGVRTELVFASPDGEPLRPNAVSMAWARARVGVTLHALRHTHASSLIAAGVDILTISRRLGHSKPNITLNVYGHLFASTDDRASQAIEDLLARIR
jgi:integrase